MRVCRFMDDTDEESILRQMSGLLIYHICRHEEFDASRALGCYRGSSQDTADGFIHFSSAAQLAESARRHRAGQTGLVLLAVNAESLGDALRWEPSRRGELFPHLYGSLPLTSIIWARDLPLGADGQHILPALD
jgi:uncharacterized protein (DUF952 family)